MLQKQKTELKDNKFIKSFEYSFFKESEKKISEKLTIDFADGRVVEYSLPVMMGLCQYDMQTMYNQMCECESVGKFWHKHIKDILPYKKIR